VDDSAILLDGLNIAMWKKRRKAGGERDLEVVKSGASLRGSDQNVRPRLMCMSPRDVRPPDGTVEY
jgi:hypothetical protein